MAAPLFRPSDILTGLQGFWKFDGDATDSSSNGNDLTAINSPSYSTITYWKDGEESSDLESGSSQYFQITDGDEVGLDITSSYTFATWFKLESLTGDHSFIGKGGATGNGWYVRVSAGDGGTYRVFHNTSSWAVISATSTGKWYHFASVYDTDANVINYYLDGNLIGSNACTTDPTSNTTNFKIGVRDDGSDYFDGLLKDVAVWNTALTPLQIKSLALGVDLSTYGFRPDDCSTSPDIWLKMNEVSGNAIDSSGNGYDFTDGNTVTALGGYVEGIGREFAGGNEYFLLSSNAVTSIGTIDFSLGVWLKKTTTAETIGFLMGASNNLYFDYHNVGGGRLDINIAGSTQSTSYSENLNTWQHFFILRSSGTVRIYMDGVQVTSDLSASGSISQGDFYIGYSVASWYGRMADFCFWKGTALPVSDIQKLASAFPIQQEGIVSYWAMDDASGNATDSIGSNTLIETSGTIATTSGIVTTARDFNRGIPDYFEITDAAQTGLDENYGSGFSIFGWMKFDSVASVFPIPWGKGSDITASGGYSMFIDGGTQMQTYHDTTNLTKAYGYATATWYHLGQLCDGANDIIYRDSILENSTANALGSGNANSLRFGSCPGNANYMDGAMCEVLFACRYFRPEEIKSLYCKGLNGLTVTSEPVTPTSPTTSTSRRIFIIS